MAGQDSELDLFRNGVSCAALLERLPPPWRLDRRESTRRALKYRRGEGEILIVNHDGRGWWDPHSAAKGDVFDLVQHLDPSLNFGQVRQILRPFIGLSPTYPEPSARLSTGFAGGTFAGSALRIRRGADDTRPVAERWNVRPRLRPGAPAWAYLAIERRLTAKVLIAAERADAVRQGAYGSAWFAHRDASGAVSHVEIRGPDFKGSLRGGRKTLFRLRGNGNAKTSRLALTEAPIDALSLAALEDLRPDTLYAATGGGMGPGTVEAIERALAEIAGLPSAQLDSAVDANRAGEHYADRHAELAAAAGVPFARLPPTIGIDWNDTLRRRGI